MRKIFRSCCAAVMAGTIVFLSSTWSHAGMSERLEGHWSKSLLQEKIVSEFFPKFAENNFEKLSPKAAMSLSDVITSFNVLYKKYQKEELAKDLVADRNLQRREVLRLLEPVLKDSENHLPEVQKISAYQDCKPLTEEEMKLLHLLTERELLKGVSEHLFAPTKIMTQSEVMILLQRIASYLEKEKTSSSLPLGKDLSFQITEESQNHNDREGFSVEEREGKVLLTITKKFPTPGYGLSVERMVVSGNGITVLLNVQAPARDLMVPQVITYRKIKVEMKKADIPTWVPLKFSIEGLERNDM